MKVAPRMHTELLTMIAPAQGSGVDVGDEGWFMMCFIYLYNAQILSNKKAFMYYVPYE